MSRLISRNPFARTEIHRESVHSTRSCDWCGNRRLRMGRWTETLFAYRIESDGGRKTEIGGLFCSVSCMKTYHSWEPL